jgi:hypothetical protein
MITFMQLGTVLTLDVLTVLGPPLIIRLYKVDRQPLPSDVFADYVEADFDGYASEILAWSPAGVNPLGKGQANAASLTWTQTGIGVMNTIFGVYVATNTDVLMFAERFPAPIAMDAIGKQIFNQPVLTAVTG